MIFPGDIIGWYSTSAQTTLHLFQWVSYSVTSLLDASPLSRRVTAVTQELCSYQQLSGIVQHRESFTAHWKLLTWNFKNLSQDIIFNINKSVCSPVCFAWQCSLSCIRLFVAPFTVAHQGPMELPMEFSRQEYIPNSKILFSIVV